MHTGLYLGWIIDSDLHSEEFADDNADLITQFKERKCQPCEIYEVNDGCLADDMLNQSGNAFTQSYFDFSNGRFLKDYDKTLAKGLPSLYHVQGTWANYDKLKAVIDQRYKEWKASPM